MNPEPPFWCLTPVEKRCLLRLAKDAIESAVNQCSLAPVCLEDLPPALSLHAASFVTLYRRGSLRGCVGGLEPRMPLAEDVREHALMAALHDCRFEPVDPDELPGLDIEISVLSPTRRLEFADPADLLARLRPTQDGVILTYGDRRGTLLPQVWKRIPDRVAFLGALCEKMGLDPCAWQTLKMSVFTYEVVEFSEAELQDASPP